MRQAVPFTGITITLFLIYSGLEYRISDTLLSVVDTSFTLLLLATFIYVVLRWVSERRPEQIGYMAVCWTGLMFLDAHFVPLGVLMFPVLFFSAVNQAMGSINLIPVPGERDPKPVVPVTSFCLHGDIPLEWPAVKPVLKSIGLFLVFPGVVFLGYTAIKTGFVWISPEFWSLPDPDTVTAAGHQPPLEASVLPVTLISDGLPTEITPRLVAFLFVAWIALWQLGSRPLLFYVSAAPSLSLLIAAVGQSDNGLVTAPDLILAASVLTTLLVAGTMSGGLVRWSVVSALIVSMGFPLSSVFQESLQINQSIRQSVIIPEAAAEATERLEQSEAASAADQTHVPEVADSPVETPLPEPVYTVSWNDSDRYYFEVKVVNSTGSLALRNYQRLLDQDESGRVTLIPQYREGRFVRWLVGVGQYTTYWDAANAIRAAGGDQALEEAFIVLHHYTDFRVFGDAPDYNPSAQGYTLLLGTVTSHTQAEMVADAWNQIGFNQVRIIAIPSGSRYQIVTGRYNDQTEVSMLAEYVTRKSGIDVRPVPLPD